jgi:lipid II:glycine glycyltransferase (peptidoglycan interpeptide bridge formation enzyme)
LLKSEYPKDSVWSARRVKVIENDRAIAGAQILFRRLLFPFRSMAYIPRGPFFVSLEYKNIDESQFSKVFSAIREWVHKNSNAFFLKVEPDIEFTKSNYSVHNENKLENKLENKIENKDIAHILSGITWPKDFKKTENGILFPRTLIIDLNKSEDEIKKGIRKKTRYYVRKTENDKDLTVEIVQNEHDLHECIKIYKETAARAKFPIHESGYYEKLFDLDISKLFVAKYKSECVAFLWLATSGETAFELYGGTNQVGQQVRANHLLKWCAIINSKESGQARYDFNGLLNDGITFFKKGFSDTETLLVGTADSVFNKALYFLWDKLLPVGQRVLRLLAKIHKESV